MGVYAFDRARDLDLERPAVTIGLPKLTRREREVLTWAAAGKSASMIADILSISERTAVARTVNATQKLDAPNKTAAVAKALRLRLVPGLLTALDAWIEKQPEPKPSRPEAIRIALRDWLTGLGLLKATDEREDRH